MVVRIVTGKSLKGALRYNEQKVAAGKAELLTAHLFLGEPMQLRFQDKWRRFERLLSLRPRVKTNALHLSLNFAPGERLSREQLQAIAAQYMERIGFGQQPYLVYSHHDAAHPHLHLVSTNIQADGTRIDLHNIGRHQSDQARRAIEQAFGLIPAEGRRQTEALHLAPIRLEKAVYGQSETRRSLARIVGTVTRTYNYTSLPELNAVLRTFGVTATPVPGKEAAPSQGLVYQLLDGTGARQGVPLRAGSLPGKPTLANLEKRFAHNRALRPALREQLRRRVDQALRLQPVSADSLARHLQQAGVQVLFRESAAGKVYGVTFLDHRYRIVCNGRELGKAYGAKALLERFAANGQSAPARAVGRGLDRSDEATNTYSTTGHDAPGSLELLTRAEQQANWIPYPLRRKRKKRKRNQPMP